MIAFQSTLPHGSDPFGIVYASTTRSFQSTLPHGSDQTISAVTPRIFLFQSTLPHGSDYFQTRGVRPKKISIHAPSRERPVRNISIKSTTSYFNPRSLTGATLLVISPVRDTVDFNPRSLTGATV